MPQHRVLERSFIGNAIVEEGAIVSYDGEAGPNLQPIEEPAPAAPARKPSGPAAKAAESNLV